MPESTDATQVLDSLCTRLDIAQGSTADDIVAEIRARAERSANENDGPARQALEDMLTDFSAKLDRVPAQRTIEQPAEEPTTPAANFRAYLARPASPTDATQRDLQRANDDLILLDAILAANQGRQYGGMRSLAAYEEFQREAAGAMRAVSAGTAGSGYEWVPTEMSGDFWTVVNLDLRVAAQFDQIEIPQGVGSLVLPGLSAHTTAYKASESTADDAAKATASTPTSENRTLTPVKLMAGTYVSAEADEDMVRPTLPTIRDDLAFALAYGLENAIVNGDTDGSLDTDNTAANDQRRLFNGLRHSALSAAKSDLSTFNADNLIALRVKMQKYGAIPSKNFWLGGVSSTSKLVLLRDSNNNLVITRLSDAGPEASNAKGAVAALFGSPVIVSETCREDLNASGAYDGVTTTYTHLMNIFRPSWKIGMKRALTIKADEDIWTDQRSLVATMRVDFKSRALVTSQRVVADAYKIS